VDKKQIIEKFFEGTSFLVRGKEYSAPLPHELAQWYCYTSDGGHSVLILIEGEFDEEHPRWQELCPAPVKSVLRSYRVVGDFVAARLDYDNNIGLITEAEDNEF
jgi:hypothetical protein